MVLISLETETTSTRWRGAPRAPIWTKTPWILTNACDAVPGELRKSGSKFLFSPVASLPQCGVWLCVTIHRELPSDPLETDYSNNYSDVLWEI